MSQTRRSDRMRDYSVALGSQSPNQTLDRRHSVGSSAGALRGYAEDIFRHRPCQSERLGAADALSEAAEFETSHEAALEDYAKAYETYSHIIELDRDSYGLLLSSGIKAAMQRAFIPARQAIRLTGTLPDIPIRDHAANGLLELGTQIQRQWDDVFSEDSRFERKTLQDLTGSASEFLILSLLLRYGQRHITDGSGSPDTSWFVVPTTIGQDRAGMARGADRKGWDISVLTQIEEDCGPIVAQKIQVKTRSSENAYDNDISVVAVKDDMIAPYNRDAISRTTGRLGARKIISLLTTEVQSQPSPRITDALDGLTDYLLDKIE